MNKNSELIVALESLVAFLKDRPEFPELDGSQMSCLRFLSKEELPANVRLLGTCKKIVDDSYYTFTKDFGARLHLSVFTYRKELCQQVVVGEKLIPAQEEKIIPATIIPAKPEQIVPVYAWSCPDTILGIDPDGGPETPLVPPISEPAEEVAA